jgi:death-on-curing protein
MSQPIWLRHDVVLSIHRRQLAEHGGTDGIRDEGLLVSALQKPRDLFSYGSPAPDHYDLVAAYGFGLARNHPFADGNKRVALVTMRLFLKLNGVTLGASPEAKYLIIMRLAAGEMSQDELADWLRSHCP